MFGMQHWSFKVVWSYIFHKLKCHNSPESGFCNPATLHTPHAVVSTSSLRALSSSYHRSQGHPGEGDGAVRVQFPRLPPEWKERYKPGQMYRYQASLPKLPVPPLHQSLQNYIATVEVCMQSLAVISGEFGTCECYGLTQETLHQVSITTLSPIVYVISIIPFSSLCFQLKSWKRQRQQLRSLGGREELGRSCSRLCWIEHGIMTFG